MFVHKKGLEEGRQDLLRNVHYIEQGELKRMRHGLVHGGTVLAF